MQEPYWYVDYAGFEQKQSRANRLIIGLRRWSPEGTKRAQLFLKQNIKVPTKLIHRENKEKLREIAEAWRDNPDIHKHKLTIHLSEHDAAHIDALKKKYPGLDVQIRQGDFDVFQMTIPYDRNLIKALGKDFQNGNYDRNFRFENDWMHRKVSLNPALEERITSKDDKSEIVLDSADGIKFNGWRMNASEFRNQVWFYADIEKPLFKSGSEKTNIDRRESLLKLRDGKRNYKAKLEALLEGSKKSMEEAQVEINARIDRITGRLEKRLTKNIAGYEVKIWEEKYDAKISWYTFIMKKADGSELRQLHTIRDCGLDKINGYDIILHETEKDLLNEVIKMMKKNNVAVFSNHNLPYDVTQTRFAAEETGADSLDLFIDDVSPRRDVVRKAYQRMKKDLEYIDTYRLAVVFHPWLKNKKLETFACDRLGEGVFKKSLTYAQMRELEVRAINGDKDAAKLLADYASSDVEPVKRIGDEGNYLETIFKIREMFPFLTITEIAFSPRVVKKYFDSKHWAKNKNNRHFGYGRKVREDEEQIFKKRFGPLKREYLGDWAFKVPEIMGVHHDVVQAYLPLEQWLQETICAVEPKWREYFNSLSQDPIERFGQLRYPRDFSNEFLMDHYFAVNEQKKFKRRLRSLGISGDSVGALLDSFGHDADREVLDKYLASLNNLRNQYRSLYVKLDPSLRKLIRVPKRFSGGANMQFDFVDFFEGDNSDLFALRKNASELSESLNESPRRDLDRFCTNFETYEEKSRELVQYAPKNVPGLSQENLVYSYALREAFAKRAGRFKHEYGITIDSVTDALRSSYALLRDDIAQRKTDVISHKGDYLFLKGGDLADLKTVIPIRRLQSFEVGMKEDESNGEGLAF